MTVRHLTHNEGYMAWCGAGYTMPQSPFGLMLATEELCPHCLGLYRKIHKGEPPVKKVYTQQLKGCTAGRMEATCGAGPLVAEDRYPGLVKD